MVTPVSAVWELENEEAVMPNPEIMPEAAHLFVGEVLAGLTKPGQKELPSKYLYDEIGSKLFEVISALPEYGLTRADERLLRLNAHAMAEALPGRVVIAELGSGSGKKTRFILKAFSRRGPTFYHPIEISATALAMCEFELSDMEAVSIVGFEKEYLEGLREVGARRKKGEKILVLFLGSTIGNFDPPADIEFLQKVQGLLKPGDALLLGTDLEKPIGQLIAAYDDNLGVTAAFNLNLLARVNRDLDADFVLSQFRHQARFNPETRSIEMHLKSTCAQTVSLDGGRVKVNFQEGETIWTESSRKFSFGDISRMAEASGFHPAGQWIDHEWPFAENLWIVK
jgi:dimethylhistidine N-methyltransferase